jgi:spore coat protein CotH
MAVRWIHLSFALLLLGLAGCGKCGEPGRSASTRPGARSQLLHRGAVSAKPSGGKEGFEELKALFAPHHLPTFHITLSEAAEQELRAHPYEYQPAGFRYVSDEHAEEVVLSKVGVRLKGRFSRRSLDEKAPFKIRFNKYVSGQRFKGLRRLTLNNMIQDPSTLRERLAYLVYREAGVPAPLCNHARVYVNDDYFGLYANVETLDESFLDRHFDPPDGNLYDTINNRKVHYVDLVPEARKYFELETDNGVNNTTDLGELIRVAQIEGPRFFREAGRIVDWEAFWRFGAVQAIIADWDGYFGSSNNYKIYHDVVSDRFIMFPWGTDQSFNIYGGFYNNLHYNIDASNLERPHGVLFTKCMADEICFRRYLETVDEVLSLFESLELDQEVNRILAQSGAAIREDQRMQLEHTMEEYEISVQKVRDFIERRGDIVSEQLADLN